MGLESATYISDLDVSNPTGSDDRKLGDDHIRLIKTTLKNTLPNGSRAFRFETVLAKTAAYTVLTTDARALITCDVSAGSFTLTLPLGSSVFVGFTVLVSKLDSSVNAVTVDGNGAETIQGAASRSLTVQYQCEKYIWNGTEWKVIAITKMSSADLLDNSVTTSKIVDKNVTLAKVQDIATIRLLGRTTAGAGVIEELQVDGTMNLSGGLLGVADNGIDTLKILDGAVTLAKQDDIATDSLIGRDTAGVGVPEVISLGFGLAMSGAGVLNAPGAFGTQLLHLQDQRTSGTDGGAFSSGAWRTRVLNTTLTAEITGASLATNQITLPAGTYYMEALAAMGEVQGNQMRLQNITDTTTAVLGLNRFSASGTSARDTAFLAGRFSIGTSKVFELQHRCAATKTVDGFGSANSFGTEVYADIRIWKLS